MGVFLFNAFIDDSGAGDGVHNRDPLEGVPDSELDGEGPALRNEEEDDQIRNSVQQFGTPTGKVMQILRAIRGGNGGFRFIGN